MVYNIGWPPILKTKKNAKRTSKLYVDNLFAEVSSHVGVGATGATGPQGPTGAPGATGATCGTGLAGSGDPVSGKMVYAVRNSYQQFPDVLSYDSEFTTLVRNNSDIFTFTNNNVITVLRNGLYKVEYNNTFRNRYSDVGDLNIRTTVTINGVVDMTLGGQNSKRILGKASASFGTNYGSFKFSLNANDEIRLNNTIFQGAAPNALFFDVNNPEFSPFDLDYRTSVNSTFDGIQLLEGSNMIVTLLD